MFIAVLLVQHATAVGALPPEPITAADLAATESVVFPGTDAEILLSEHRIESSGEGVLETPEMTGSASIITVVGRSSPARVLPTIEAGRSYTERRVRVKTYTERGVEMVRTVSVRRPRLTVDVEMRRRAETLFVVGVRHGDRTDAINGVWARVVKPDGSIHELGTDDLHPDAVSGAEAREVRIAFPGLVPGDIVEYGWTTDSLGTLSGAGISCQELFPIRECRFVFVESGAGFAITWLNCDDVKTTRQGNELHVVLRNLPAVENEPFMPALWDSRAGLFFVRSEDWKEPKRLWLGENARWSESFAEVTSSDKSIAEKAGELVAGAASDDEKLRRIHEFCQGGIMNFDLVDTPEVRKERADFLAWRSRQRGNVSREILRWVLTERKGDSETIDFVFAALARGAGFSVYQTRGPENTQFGKVHNNLGWDVLSRRLVAVEVGGRPMYFNPGRYFLPYGMLDRRDEGAPALRVKGRSVQSAQTPRSSAECNARMRKGRFHLTPSGDLEGEVEEVRSGHIAVETKEWCASRSDAEASERVRREVTGRIESAEVGAVEFLNLRTREMPLVVRYHVRVAGFAHRSGGRLVLAPSFFELGEQPVLVAEARRLPVCFPYAWHEHDDIEIVLPPDFELENPSAPSPVGDCTKFGVAYSMKYQTKTRTLVYGRDFVLGGNGVLRFPVAAYPALLRLFDAVAKGDRHLLQLEPVAGAQDPGAGPGR